MSVWRKDLVAEEHLQLLQSLYLLPSIHMAAETWLKFQFYQAYIRYIDTNAVFIHTLFIVHPFIHLQYIY